MGFDEILGELRGDESVGSGSGATADQIAAAERVLGIAFPRVYQQFLSELGWAKVYYDEIFGLGDTVPQHLDLVRVTQSERNEFRPYLPVHLIPLVNDGLGNHYCLDTSRVSGSDCPVVFWDHEHELAEDQVPEDESPTFAEWLEDRLREGCKEGD